MTVEQIADISQQVVAAKEKVMAIEYRITEIEKKKCFDAKLTLSIGEYKTTSAYQLTQKEVLQILNDRLSIAKDHLSKAEDCYEEAILAANEPKTIIDTSENIDQTKAVKAAENIIKK